MLEGVFWVGVVGVLYPYFAYPAIIWLVGKVSGTPPRSGGDATVPTVSMIVPVHNEESRIERKIRNTAALTYPAERLQVLYVSDGSTDRTVDLLRAAVGPRVEVLALPLRSGKAAALNAGLSRAVNDVLVFSDASIELESDALQQIVKPFADPLIGCVSGEDHIPESGGEAYYGRYELMLRRLESRLHSIVGASGSFYAQRRSLCGPFTEGMAPDFLSVLRTGEQGFRAVTEPSAVGVMTSLKDPRQEFERKVRTLIRGMTTLFAHAHVLNPFRFGWFSFALLSHKVMRWLAPVFLLLAFLAPLGLLQSRWYAAAFAAQLVFYLIAAASFKAWAGIDRSLAGKVALYFTTVNTAAAAAWVQYARGVRQELWTPSRRSS